MLWIAASLLMLSAAAEEGDAAGESGGSVPSW